jgi:hypothetical protein
VAGDHDRAGRTTAYKSDYAYELPSLDSIRRFVVVAEHLKFGRAAEALHIAQPVLSRQIRALEHELRIPPRRFPFSHAIASAGARTSSGPGGVMSTAKP